MSLPRPALLILFWICAAIAVASQLFAVRAVMAGRAPTSSRRRGAHWRELAWVVIPTLMLLAVLAATWKALSLTESAGSATFLS